MSESEPTKLCPMCAETIKAAARLCPFCQSRQSRFAVWRSEVTGAVFSLSLVGLALTVCVWLEPDEEGVGGRNFGRHRQDLVVRGTTLGRGKAKPEYWLTGFVTNRGEHPWRVHTLEVRFLDRQSSVLDALHPHVKELFVVQPSQEHAFRVELGSLSFTNNEVSHQVRVQIATDGDRPLKSD